jgi:hypothetical protein
MTSASVEPGRRPAASPLTRVAQVALVLNAALATIAGAGFLAGELPHSAEEPTLARRAGLTHFAGAFIMLFVARRVRRDAALIVLPVAFVLCNLADSVYERLVLGDPSYLAPMIVEAALLSIYALFAVACRRPPT